MTEVEKNLSKQKLPAEFLKQRKSLTVSAKASLQLPTSLVSCFNQSIFQSWVLGWFPSPPIRVYHK